MCKLTHGQCDSGYEAPAPRQSSSRRRRRKPFFSLSSKNSQSRTRECDQPAEQPIGQPGTSSTKQATRNSPNNPHQPSDASYPRLLSLFSGAALRFEQGQQRSQFTAREPQSYSMRVWGRCRLYRSRCLEAICHSAR